MQEFKLDRYRLRQYGLLMRIDRPVGIFLLLWPTLWALWIAGEGKPDLWVMTVFVLGVFLMRSSGCVINDYADRDIDRYVARTADRPLTSGRVTEKETLLLFVGLTLLAFILVLTLNWLTIGMSVIGAVLAATYPFMKRHSYLPQVYLGLAFGWSVPMAFAAQTGSVSIEAWLLLLATVLWATAYDTMYAMVDRPDDLKIGVKSTAILFGAADRVIIGIIQTLLMLVLIMVGQRLELGMFYFSCLFVAAMLMVYQQYLIRDRDGMKCFKAFLNNNWVGIAVFVGVVGHYM
ncbi:4-hydroxybenzoate octaprenyltransferase [Pseudomonadota bacterium]